MSDATSRAIRLFLVRHGNTFEKGEVCTQVGAKSDLPLTDKGREQARQMAEHLQSLKITPSMVYAGSLVRQIEAAEIIAREIGDEVKVSVCEDALDEIDYGPWEGLTTEEIEKRWPQQYRDWTDAGGWPDDLFGGTLQGKLAAIEAWLNELKRSCRNGDTVVAVTSNGTIRFFYSFLKDEWERLVLERRIKELKVSTGSYCEMLIGEEGVEVVSWNSKPN